MPNDAETAIYNRLAAAPTFHPADVRLLPDDWALEAGDVVTVSEGDDSYNVPIYAMDLDWRGSPQVNIQSTGNQQRDPLAVLSHRQYGAGSGGYGAMKAQETKFKEYNTHFEQTDTYFSLLATQSEWDEMAQAGHVTAYSEIRQTASDIALVVVNHSTINAASIVAAVNNAGSSVTISADKIVLNGETLTNALSATNARITNLMSGNAQAEKLNAGILNAVSAFQAYNTLAIWIDKAVLDSNGDPVTIHYLGHL